MVVVCASCSTRFRIDDARIPAKGRLVRCSQCKATFVAMPAHTPFDETVQEIVAEVSAAGGPTVPEPASDLFDAGGEDLSDERSRREAGSDEERWEFDETPRASAAELDRAGSPADDFAPDDAAAPLDEVGDPVEWDLLHESVEPAAREARFVEVGRLAREPAALAAPKPLLEPVVVQPTPQPLGRAERGRGIAQLARLAFTAAAWFTLAGLAGLAALALMPSLDGGSGLHAARSAPQSFALADGEARAVRVVFVENAFAGTLLVVEGELSRSQPDPLGLRVHLVNAAGERLGAGTLAGAVRPRGELRELAPERLRSEIEAGAAALARGGKFIAIFETVPSAATGLELALERLPAVESPAAPGEVESPAAPGEVGPPAAPGGVGPSPLAPEPTASSPPSPLPSSG